MKTVYTSKDICGNILSVGDYVVTTCSITNKQLHPYKITKISNIGNLSVEGFIRTNLNNPELYCLKITEEQYKNYKGIKY